MASKFVELADVQENQNQQNLAAVSNNAAAINPPNLNTNENIAVKQDQKETQINKFQALFTQINVMMGMGPLILPSVFYESGVVLSGFFLILIGFFSYISAEFIIEGMSICNYIQYTKHKYEKTQLKTDNEAVQQADSDKIANQQQQNPFELNQKFEYGEMGEVLIGKIGKFVISLIIIFYLIGVMIMKCMATAHVMSKVFENFQILSSYNLWLISFFLISAVFSFKNVQDTQGLQSFIFYIRVITVISMLIGCFNSIYLTGMHPLYNKNYPPISFQGFNRFFSNAVFAYNMHHSLPSMSKPIHPSRDIKKVLMSSFTIAISVFFSLCLSGILAFGDSLVEQHDLKLFNFNFKEQSPFVYYLSGFYVFLNITAFPVMTITSRNNLLAFFPSQQNTQTSNENQQQQQQQQEQQNNSGFTLKNIIGSLSILIPVFFISVFVKNIQVVLNVIGGILGSIMLNIIPAFLVIKGRQVTQNLTPEEQKDFFHKTLISSNIIPLMTLIIGILCCLYNSYLVIHELFM
ncbi:transmembrane amino acid transporter protein (macronuclear) [Tetrahymena thermophila SB210]|uniref:Transmembrane amino acid transporter protein n=1 Tax=Tetrahymena thermophila (strain SB210) TaxID=312017 RepID=Q24DJ1_TETTS|nr:transmembrane amino acid transporter protein [Tetrahymena thermophila SB210]EAS05857.1 transmembrane amino acid transporter protein [Tetrahymena thermophila SB210]|eukprot:XP_001026102.1 transmembrane amino acid transporter protein [Tetrahymena thermophila SB210]